MAEKEQRTVFISYSHKDERWKDQLVTHLRALQLDALEVWDDRRIGAGEDWLREIRAALRRAHVAVLLVTADFLASGFITREEVPRILRRRRTQGLHVVPIIVKPCPWHAVRWLSRIQARPKDGKPLNRSRSAHADADLATIALEIRSLLNRTTPVPAAPARRPRTTSPASTPRRGKATADMTPVEAPRRAATRSTPAITKRAKTVKPSKKGGTSRELRSISTSSSWVLLDGHPFVASSVTERDDREIVVRIPAGSSAQGAALGQLQTKYSNGYAQLTYAYQDDAALVTLVSATRDSTGGKTVWTLVLRRPDDRFAGSSHEYSLNGWSADALAELRATRLLLGDGAFPEAARRDPSVMNSLDGYGGTFTVSGPVLPSVWSQYRTDREKFLRVARLHAVQALKLARICDHITKLTLGPVAADGVGIDFAGVRPQSSTGQAPATIAVKGICPLSAKRDKR